MNIDEIVNNIPKENIFIDEPMKNHTSFKIGGPAEVFIKATKIEDIQNIVNICNKQNIGLTIIGNGTNILVTDKGIKGIVLKIDIDDYEIIKENNGAIVKVSAGMPNAKLAYILLKEEYEGFEFASGIPGTIGGAIKMNAGAYGREIKDIIQEVTYIDLEKNKIEVIKTDEMNFSYRHSIFFERKSIILNAKFKFKCGKKEKIQKKMNEYLQSRKETQPSNPSAGSTFKRGTDFVTSKLIDECGLKGMQVGGAMVSTEHAGFIVNKDNATATDVINLIQIVKETVYEKTKKKIELEIEIIGE